MHVQQDSTPPNSSPSTSSPRSSMSLEKSNSLGRSAAASGSNRFPRKGPGASLARSAAAGKRDSTGGEQQHRGVALSDKPYDD